MTIAPLELRYKPVLPPRHDYGIGIVGCGGIVNYAHLPAYTAHRLNVVACYDLNLEAARATAVAHGIPQVHETLEALLADPQVEIVDIAVPAWEQRAIAERALAAGKHLLCQKPLAEHLDDARAIVAAGARAGRKVAVNQQMRWSAGIAAARDLIGRGFIGQVTDAQIQVSICTPWHMWPWLRDAPRLEVMYHSIHYLDSLRSILGDPQWVTSRHTKYPGQPERAETKTVTVLDYPSGLQALIAVNHHDESGDSYATYRFLGTEGVIKGTIGLLYNYPHGRPDTLQCHSTRVTPAVWYDIALEGLWIPDAFIGPMASLMEAIQTGGAPATDAADNLGTLRAVHAAYRSAAEHRSVRPDEL
ncbi:MAG TPA: Gfo/Idh/MocA family oxidoreductase [Roseiflexaceae bacterium]|nr:Gfo/Idh/MocA family oxidoreductase [Roseiflexaceae bacterium]